MIFNHQEQRAGAKTDSSGQMVIEHGIPIPRSLKEPIKWPFAKMSVGDSVLIAEQIKYDSAVTASYRLTKKYGWKFVRRKMHDGLRFWRVE